MACEKYSAKVSIIMPSLNVAEYIGRALDSVTDQTLKDVEIICVDAGSDDGTLEIIDRKRKEDDRVRLLHSPVRSYGHQVNMGLASSVGKYVAVLETDDFVSSEMYGELYNLAESENLDYAKCDYETYSCDTDGDFSIAERRITSSGMPYQRAFIPLQYPQSAIDDWYLWNGIYSREFINKNNISLSETEGAAFQDIGFLHKTAVPAKRVQFLGKSLYRYCVGRAGASSKSGRAIFFIRQEYGQLLDAIGDHAATEEWRLLYYRMAKSFAKACMDINDEILLGAEVERIIEWFQKRLLSAERMGVLNADALPIGLRDAYRHLVHPSYGYMAYRRNREKAIRDFVGTGNPVVIFGCGVYGREAYNYLHDMDITASYFMDNSNRLWGGNVLGITVKSPFEISEMPKDTRYIIANENHADEIMAQLQKVVGGDRVLIF